ncbi:MAG TPA: STAS domain-containing protein [Terriglobales bacterium]|nr:STAS domain-containing protein [Terriglobales bacterium]
MEIDVRKKEEVQVIHLHGDLKIGDPVDSFRQTVEELFGQGDSRIVVDVGDVPMIDSSGIGALVRLLTIAKQRGGALKLVNPSKLAVQTLKIVGLLNLFEIYEDEGQAVSSFN